MIERLWRVDRRKVLCRDECGRDTDNLVLDALGHRGACGTITYRVLKNEIGTKCRRTVFQAGDYLDARFYIIDFELSVRRAFICERMTRWSAKQDPERLLVKPERTISLHGNMPSEKRMLDSECLARSTSDPLSPCFDRREQAEGTSHAGTHGTPWHNYVMRKRAASRANQMSIDGEWVHTDCAPTHRPS